MAHVVVRYKVTEGRGDENQALVEAVFAELADTQPEGLKYATFRLADGVSFVHVADVDGDSPLNDSPAFAAFTADIVERCDEPPAPSPATVVGQYGLLA